MSDVPRTIKLMRELTAWMKANPTAPADETFAKAIDIIGNGMADTETELAQCQRERDELRERLGLEEIEWAKQKIRAEKAEAEVAKLKGHAEAMAKLLDSRFENVPVVWAYRAAMKGGK